MTATRSRSQQLCWALAATLVLCAITACTSITVVERDGSTKVSRSFGFASVELNPGTEAMLAEITSLGYLGGPLGVSIGYNSTVIAATARDCRLIVWLRSHEDAAKLEQLLGAKRSGVCVIQVTTEEKQP